MDQLDPAIREQLVAYLDGELDAESSRRIEELLANDPRVRAALQGLDRTWELLDELDTPPVREGFTHTTLEMVAVAAAKDAQQARSEAPRRRRQRRLLVLAGLLWAGLAGFLIAKTVLPDPNRELLQDLPLLESLDQYREVDSLDFLRLLVRNKLFVEESDAGGSEPAESLAQRPRSDQKHEHRPEGEPAEPAAAILEAGAGRAAAGAAVARPAPQRSRGRQAPRGAHALLPVVDRAAAVSPIAIEGSAAGAADPADQEDSTIAGGQPARPAGSRGIAALDRSLRAAARGPAAGNGAGELQEKDIQGRSGNATPLGLGPDL